MLSLLLIIPIILFLIHFGRDTISNDISVWASFVDYIGGRINTVQIVPLDTFNEFLTTFGKAIA